MAMMKAGVAGAAIGALGLATLMFIAPIAAQGPGAPPGWGDGWRGQGGPGGPGGRSRGPDDPDQRGPGMMGQGQGQGRDDMTGPGMMRPGQGRGGPTGPGQMARPGADPDDADITGPRGNEVSSCQERLAEMTRWRLARVQRLVRPTDEQRGAFEELRMASVRALDIMRAACAAEQPLTPPARMAASEKRLEARLQAIRTMRPALDNFYRLLSDEQKIRWSLDARAGRDDDRMRWLDRPGRGDGGRMMDRNPPGHDHHGHMMDGGRMMERGYGGQGRDQFDRGRERAPDRFQRDRDGGPMERFGHRFEDERTRRPPQRWDDRRRDDDRDWRDNRRPPHRWDDRGGGSEDEERL